MKKKKKKKNMDILHAPAFSLDNGSLAIYLPNMVIFLENYIINAADSQTEASLTNALSWEIFWNFTEDAVIVLF